MCVLVIVSRDKTSFNRETRGFPTLIDIFVIQMNRTPVGPWDWADKKSKLGQVTSNRLTEPPGRLI